MVKKQFYSAPTSDSVEVIMSGGIAQTSELVINEIVDGTSGEDFIWD